MKRQGNGVLKPVATRTPPKLRKCADKAENMKLLIRCLAGLCTTRNLPFAEKLN